MSASLIWEPVVEPPEGGGLSLEMREALIGDSSREMLNGEGIVLDASEAPWLRGIIVGAPAGSDLHSDATALLAAIGEHGRVRVRLIY